MSMQFTHLGWPGAPRLAARLLFMQAISSHYEAITCSGDARVGDELHGLTDSVLAVAKSTISFVDSEAPARFEVLLGNLGGVAQAQSMVTDLARKVRDSFVSTASQWRCSNCSPDPVCGGSDAWVDDRALSTNGRCIAELKRLFESAVALARQQYPASQYSELVIGSEFRRVSDLSVASVAGTTRTISSNPPVRRLALVVDPDRFDKGAFLSVFFVFFHESFVHGLAGLAPGDPEALLADPFAEGWMDWIAVKLLRDWATSDAKHVWPFSLRQAFADSGEAYHFARMNGSSRYLTGALAAQRLLSTMRRMDTSDAHAWNVFVRYSVRVNASNSSGATRGLLVRAVNASLMDTTDRSGPQVQARRLATQAVDGYVNGGAKWATLTKSLIRAAEPVLG